MASLYKEFGDTLNAPSTLRGLLLDGRWPRSYSYLLEKSLLWEHDCGDLRGGPLLGMAGPRTTLKAYFFRMFNITLNIPRKSSEDYASCII